ncbi:hypothetical protein HID58_042943 [Brassica napus]|uniref:Uncharacterized protein n=1 Tax=Brassica napus TaxID=3708 RepID=A0ABQ8BF22_BRANA|nr:hypothetical protein HID58_042943 [Brassica napus]
MIPRPPIWTEEAAWFHKRVKRIRDPVKIVVPCAVFEAGSPIPPDRNMSLMELKPIANSRARGRVVEVAQIVEQETEISEMLRRSRNVSNLVSFAGEAVAKLIMGVPRRFRWVTFLMIREAMRHSRVCGNVARLPVSVVYDEYQKVKARKRHLSFTPPPRLARAALSANGLSSISSTSAEIFPNRDLLVDAYRKLTGEVFLLRSQVLGYFCVQAIRAQLYGMIGGRRRVVECILLLR